MGGEAKKGSYAQRCSLLHNCAQALENSPAPTENSKQKPVALGDARPSKRAAHVQCLPEGNEQ